MKCCLFSNFQQDFSSCLLTADLLIIVFDRIAWAFNKLWQIELCHLIYRRYSTEFGMLFFIARSKHKLSYQVSALFLDFLKKDRFKWFFMENVCKSITSTLALCKYSFLVLQFSLYMLMSFLMLLVILLSISMILLSALCVIRLWCSYLVFITKIVSKKIEALIHSM